MRIIFFIFFIVLLSCNKNINEKKTYKIDISNNLTFDEFKKLIEEKGFKENYPDINQ
tara:strand:+ start:321 stop:491 length:171 start_codon:yes stop_codon:yes gene_type:complete